MPAIRHMPAPMRFAGRFETISAPTTAMRKDQRRQQLREDDALQIRGIDVREQEHSDGDLHQDNENSQLGRDPPGVGGSSRHSFRAPEIAQPE